jgi:hypothetical protein
MTVLSVPGNVYRRNTVERTRIAIIFFHSDDTNNEIKKLGSRYIHIKDY